MEWDPADSLASTRLSYSRGAWMIELGKKSGNCPGESYPGVQPSSLYYILFLIAGSDLWEWTKTNKAGLQARGVSQSKLKNKR